VSAVDGCRQFGVWSRSVVDTPTPAILHFQPRLYILGAFGENIGQPMKSPRRANQQNLLAIDAVSSSASARKVVSENAAQIPFGLGAEKWEQHFNDLQEFYRIHGHLNVPVVYRKNPGLGSWVNGQRVKKRQGKLLSYRKKRLENLGFSWACGTA